MPLIQQLSSHLADLIAAGEVVERPASVVKELLENAIDAGASAITVELQGGGMSLIRVSDNGCGIIPDELPTAFLRHATSKLRTEEDLSAIGTLGFRGEALAAIAAVSRIEITSRRRGAAHGARLLLEGGSAGTVEDFGCPEGTTIIVRDLFYNTPARMKFMKKDSAEASAAAAVVQHEALSHARISFKLIRDGAEQLCTSGDGKLLSATYSALGRDFALSLLAVQGSGNGIAVQGYITRSLQCRGTRAMQHFFVNGRYVKSPLLTAAVEEAYRNQMMKGKFPGCVLHISLPLDQVDVNVHPAKTVVKFLNERAAFDAVYYAAKAALEQGGEKPAQTITQPARPTQTAITTAISPAKSPEKLPEKKDDFYRCMSAEAFRTEKAAESIGKALTTFSVKQRAPIVSELGGMVQVADVIQPGIPQQTAVPDIRPPLSASPACVEPIRTDDSAAVAPAVGTAASEAASERITLPQTTFAPVSEGMAEHIQEALEPAAEAPWRIAGEVLRTYIIAEDSEGNVYLIDKHAAHERLNFDRMKQNAAPIMGQQLLQAEAVMLPANEYAVLLEHLELLNQFGFEAEDFGENTLICRTCPSEIDAAEIAPALEEIAEQLLRTGQADPESARDTMLHTMACKAAIKAGMVNDARELRVLVDKVQQGEIQFCPHGRPVKVKLSKYEIEKMFKRA